MKKQAMFCLHSAESKWGYTCQIRKLWRCHSHIVGHKKTAIVFIYLPNWFSSCKVDSVVCYVVGEICLFVIAVLNNSISHSKFEIMTCQLETKQWKILCYLQLFPQSCKYWKSWSNFDKLQFFSTPIMNYYYHSSDRAKTFSLSYEKPKCFVSFIVYPRKYGWYTGIVMISVVS